MISLRIPPKAPALNCACAPTRSPGLDYFKPCPRISAAPTRANGFTLDYQIPEIDKKGGLTC